MLETMEKFHGPDWTPDLEDQWRQAFDHAIKIMFGGYERRMSV
jgi:hypothetical protein